MTPNSIVSRPLFDNTYHCRRNFSFKPRLVHDVHVPQFSQLARPPTYSRAVAPARQKPRQRDPRKREARRDDVSSPGVAPLTWVLGRRASPVPPWTRTWASSLQTQAFALVGAAPSPPAHTPPGRRPPGLLLGSLRWSWGGCYTSPTVSLSFRFADSRFPTSPNSTTPTPPESTTPTPPDKNNSNSSNLISRGSSSV